MTQLCPAVVCSDYILLLFLFSEIHTITLNNKMKMKRCFFLIFTLLSINLCEAQVGINVKVPQGVFHIDPRSDTNGSNGTADDVIVLANGNVGIGTTNPEVKLHIKTEGTVSNPMSGFRLEDGNQGLGKVLTSDASGLATWMTLVYSDAISFVKPAACPNLAVPTNNYYFTNAYIDLPPGRWVVMLIMYLTLSTGANQLCTVNSTFADASTIGNNGQIFTQVVTSDIEGARLVSGIAWVSSAAGTMTGALVINNKGLLTKRYYYMVGGTSAVGAVPLGTVFSEIGGRWGEDNIVAFRIPSDL